MALHSAPSSGFSVIPILCILAYKYILKMSYTWTPHLQTLKLCMLTIFSKYIRPFKKDGERLLVNEFYQSYVVPHTKFSVFAPRAF